MSTSQQPDLRAAVPEAAARLQQAQDDRLPCVPVRDLFDATDVAAAYAVQQRLVDARRARGATVVGRKIGLTSAAVQQQLGVDQPDFGVLFNDMDVTGIEPVPFARLIQPKVEAEIAFVLGADLDTDDLDLTSVAAAVDTAVAAIEIVDSRVKDWDITIVDTVADNASSGLYVLGDVPRPLSEIDPVAERMRLYVDGELVSEGSGAACLGNPLNALLWLARTARAYGEPLRAGQVVLSGALGPMAPVAPGAHVRAELSSLGVVAVRFSEEER